MAKNQILTNVIRAIKFHFGINQAEIAKRTGIKLTYLSDLIGGRNPLSEIYSDKLSIVFGVSKEYLKTGAGNMFDRPLETISDYGIGSSELKMTDRDVKRLRQNLGFTQKELAEKIGVSLKTIANYESGGVIPEVKQRLLKSLTDTPNEMKDSFFEYSIGGNEIKPTAELSGKPPYETYLLPLSAMGGPLSGFAADSVTLANCEKIVSPIEDVDFAITIYGESMYPKYPSGARLLIKKINPDIFIDWGKAYVLDTSNGVIVKEVRMSDREGCIACHSINPDPKFRPFDVPLSEVYGMYRVLMSLSAE